jgi:LuxR family transcriptional regulator of csgAB operon
METSLNPAGAHGCLIIDGPYSVQNKALADLIEARTEYRCAIYAAERLTAWASRQPLVLLDAARCAARLPVLCAYGHFSIAVINADDNFPCEHIASQGVKGVFDADTSEDELIKGIKAIFEGEYWLPYRMLCAHLERTRSMPQTQGPAATRLTPKEVETLRLLAKGDSTKHIARQLNVSPHTVKVHTSNLFRKIQVSNRVQAAQWATCHMLTAQAWSATAGS